MKKVLKTISLMLVAVLMIGMMSMTASAASTCSHKWSTPSGQDKTKVQFCRKCSTYCYHEDTTVTHTCKSEYEITKCTFCNVQISMVDKGITGSHNYVDGKCTNCKEIDPAYKEPCTTHDWDWTKGTCNECGEECGHNSTEVIYNCKSTYKTTRCVECHYGMGSEDTGVTGPHNYGADNKCTLCGADKPCTTHTWDKTTHKCSVCKVACPHEGEKTVNYTCKSTYKTTLCEDCNEVLATENMDVAAGHSYGTDEKCIWCEAPKPCATHTWDKTTHKCSVCKVDCPHTTYEEYKHNCKSEYDVKRCVDCYYVDPESKVHTGFGDHNYGTDNKCSVCGKDKPEPCTTHDWDWTKGQCKVCDLKCVDHNYKTNHPNCTVGGYINYKCKICGYTTVENTPVEPGNHTYAADGYCTKCGHACEHESTKTTNTATCKKDGHKTVTCKICKKVLSVKKVKALGHNYVEGVCTRCGKVASSTNVVLNPGATLDKVPKTGDLSVAMMSAVGVVVVLGTGIVYARKKSAR